MIRLTVHLDAALSAREATGEYDMDLLPEPVHSVDPRYGGHEFQP